MPRISARLSAKKKESFVQYCERIGKTQSEVIEQMIDETIGQPTSNYRLPDDDQLSTAYTTLWNMRRNRKVEIPDAESTIANKLNIRKEAVRSRVMTPLEKRGYIRVQRGINKTYYHLNVPLPESELAPMQVEA